ncbi:DUF3592 domain-containing protein [Streptomyces sp. NPDC058877]|uniref:DUF3592 domain-containing protein n=1 Tax=Streptomyces sp. NPDC058877 TaxID=3346665 RepID=UPI003676EDCE
MEKVLRGIDGELRFDGELVTVIRPGETVTLPLADVIRVSLLSTSDRTAVRLDAEERTHGFVDTVSYAVASQDDAAARSFHDALATVVPPRPSTTAPATPAPQVFVPLVPVRPPRIGRPRPGVALATGLVGYAVLLLLGFLLADPRPTASRIGLLHLALLVGGLFTAVGWRLASVPIVLFRRGVRTPATVVREWVNPRSVTPRYRFTTAGGVVHVEDSSLLRASSHRADTVVVRYDPKRPSRVIHGWGLRELVAGLFFFVLGIGIVLGALGELAAALLVRSTP